MSMRIYCCNYINFHWTLVRERDQLFDRYPTSQLLRNVQIRYNRISEIIKINIIVIKQKMFNLILFRRSYVTIVCYNSL
jgi:hypothetical protein